MRCVRSSRSILWLLALALIVGVASASSAWARGDESGRTGMAHSEDPDDMAVEAEDPDDMTVGAEDPDKMTVGAEDPDKMTVGAEDPDDMTVGAENPDKMVDDSTDLGDLKDAETEAESVRRIERADRDERNRAADRTRPSGPARGASPTDDSASPHPAKLVPGQQTVHGIGPTESTQWLTAISDSSTRIARLQDSLERLALAEARAGGGSAHDTPRAELEDAMNREKAKLRSLIQGARRDGVSNALLQGYAENL